MRGYPHANAGHFMAPSGEAGAEDNCMLVETSETAPKAHEHFPSRHFQSSACLTLWPLEAPWLGTESLSTVRCFVSPRWS